MRGLTATLVAAGLSFGLCTSAVWAADPAPSPTQLALAKELIEANGTTQTLLSVRQIDQSMAQASKMGPGLDEKTMAMMKKVMTEEFDAARPALKEEVAKIFATRLSEADMKALITFYHSEAGQHLAAAQPQITEDAAALMTPVMQRMMRRLMMELIPNPDAKTESKKK